MYSQEVLFSYLKLSYTCTCNKLHSNPNPNPILIYIGHSYLYESIFETQFFTVGPLKWQMRGHDLGSFKKGTYESG